MAFGINALSENASLVKPDSKLPAKYKVHLGELYSAGYPRLVLMQKHTAASNGIEKLSPLKSNTKNDEELVYNKRLSGVGYINTE